MKISNIIYINLDKRTDRLQHVKEQLCKVGFNGERFKAIELTNGRLGCTLSHIKCIELAKKRDWNHVFVCEDDITFIKPELFLTQLNKFFESGLTWDVIIVAGNNVPPYEKYGDFCIKVSHCQTTTGYIVKKDYYDTLISNFREGASYLMRKQENHLQYAIDRNWTKLQKKDDWFLIIPPTIIQRPDYSDIEQKVTDYQWHLLDIDKKDFLEMQKLLALSKNSEITFATCWYEVKSKFSREQYYHWIRNMLPYVTNFNLVIFSNEESTDLLKPLIKDNPRIKLVLLPFEELDTFQYQNNWKKNQRRKDNPLRGAINWKLNMLWCEKINFSVRAMEYFDTEFYGWCDIGYFRKAADNVKEWPSKELKLLKDKIYYALVQNNNKIIQLINSYINNTNEHGLPIKPIPSNQISIAGGFFVTHKENIQWWKKTFYEKLELYFKHDYLVKDDQMIIANCIFQNLEKFSLCQEPYEKGKDNWFMFKRLL